MGKTSNQQSVVPLAQPPVITPPNQSFFSFFDGKKTYITVGAMIVYAVLGIYLKYMQPTDAITLILQALGIGGLRAGIAAQGL